jgi:sugar/nucleoside kinase (ribokinase family)
MLSILGDLIADFSLRIDQFPIHARSMHHARYMELGPGGATNVAITASRLGLEVVCLGEVGDDIFGRVVVEGLVKEGIHVTEVFTSENTDTPVAGVIVDRNAQPAYIGHQGELQHHQLAEQWRSRICSSDFFFTEGWIDHPAMAQVNTEALHLANQSGVTTFFDPGPGNPKLDREWINEAIQYAKILLLTENEARQLTGVDDPVPSAQTLLDKGPELVVIKRGAAGCLLLHEQEVRIAPGYPVAARDTTGAGDSLDAAIIYGYQRGLDLEDLGTFANAVGAAKVQKLGTGHNMPTAQEIRDILIRFGKDVDHLFPLSL